MKKVVLFVAVLMVAGAVALFADPPKPELSASLSGSAEFTFGIELGNTTTDLGLTNASSAGLTVTLVGTGTDSKGGKEGEEVYGWIELGDFKAVLDDSKPISFNSPIDAPDADGKAYGSWNGDSAISGAADHISAKLFLGPVFIDILGDEDKIDEAGNILGATTLAAVATLGALDQSDTNNGIHIGLKDTSVVSVIVGVSSVDTYVGQANYGTSKGWNLFAKVGLTAVPDLTVEGLWNMSTASGTNMNLGGKVGYALSIAEGMKLGITGAIDVALATTTALQVTGELTFSFPGSGLTDEDYFGATDIDIKPGVDAIFSLKSAGSASNIDLGVYLYDADLIPVINLLAALEITDLGATTSMMGYGVRADVAIDGGIAPYAEYYATSTNGTSNTGKFKVGVALSMITNTTITLSFETGDLVSTTDETGTIKANVKISY